MGIWWACLEEFQILVSWNKELEKVRQRVARKVRKCIKKKYTSMGRAKQRERSVAPRATVYNGLGFVLHGMDFYDHLHTTGWVAYILFHELVPCYMSH